MQPNITIGSPIISPSSPNEHQIDNNSYKTMYPYIVECNSRLKPSGSYPSFYYKCPSLLLSLPNNNTIMMNNVSSSTVSASATTASVTPKVFPSNNLYHQFWTTNSNNNTISSSSTTTNSSVHKPQTSFDFPSNLIIPSASLFTANQFYVAATNNLSAQEQNNNNNNSATRSSQTNNSNTSTTILTEDEDNNLNSMGVMMENDEEFNVFSPQLMMGQSAPLSDDSILYRLHHAVPHGMMKHFEKMYVWPLSLNTIQQQTQQSSYKKSPSFSSFSPTPPSSTSSSLNQTPKRSSNSNNSNTNNSMLSQLIRTSNSETALSALDQSATIAANNGLNIPPTSPTSNAFHNSALSRACYFEYVWDLNEDCQYKQILPPFRSKNPLGYDEQQVAPLSITSSRQQPSSPPSQTLSSIALSSQSIKRGRGDSFLKHLSAIRELEDERSQEAIFGDSSPLPHSYMENANGSGKGLTRQGSIGKAIKGALSSLKKKKSESDLMSESNDNNKSSLKLDVGKVDKQERRQKTLSMRFSGFWNKQQQDDSNTPKTSPREGNSSSANVSISQSINDIKTADIYAEIDINTEERKLEDLTKENLNDEMVTFINELTYSVNGNRRLSAKFGNAILSSAPTAADMNIKNEILEERLMMLLKPYYEYKPLDLILCHRTLPSLEFPVKSKITITLSVSDFSLMVDSRELFTFSLSLYDCKTERKISEDWYFNFLTEAQLSTLPPSAQEHLRMPPTIVQEKTFHVSYPHDQVYCVLVVRRIAPHSTVQEAAEELGGSSKDRKNNTNDERRKTLAHFEQSFLLGFCKLFAQKKGTSLNNSFSNTASNSMSSSFFSENIDDTKIDLNFNKIVLERFYPIIVDANIETFNIITLLKHLDPQSSHNGLQAYHIKGKVTIESRLEKDWKSSFSRSTLTKQSSYIEDDTFSLDFWDEERTDPFRPDSPHRRSTESQKRRNKSNLMLEEEMNEDIIEEIPWTKSRYPNMVYKNMMYIHLKFARLGGVKSCKHLLIEVAVRENDLSKPSPEDFISTTNTESKMLKRLIGKYNNKLQRYQFSSLANNTKKNVHFVDEIKVDLLGLTSENITAGHHLLFTFYSIDVEDSKGKVQKYMDSLDIRNAHFGSSNRNILGYAFLPLAAKNSVYEADKTIFGDLLVNYMAIRQSVTNETLMIYSKLNPGYLSASEKDLMSNKLTEKAKLKIDANLVSTIQPPDERLQLLFAAYNAFTKSTSLQKSAILEYIVYHLYNKIVLIDFSLCMPYMYLIFDILLEILNYSDSDQFVKDIATHEKIRSDLQVRTFDALVTCMNHFHDLCGNSSRGNRFFSGYVKYVFNYETLHCKLLSLFILYMHSKEQKQQDDISVESESCRYSWFIFDMAIKSLLVAQSKGVKNYEEADLIQLSKSLIQLLFEGMEKLLGTNNAANNNLVVYCNRNIALFIRDLIPFLGYSESAGVFDFYCKKVNRCTSKDTASRLLSESLAIITDYHSIWDLDTAGKENAFVSKLITFFLESIEAGNEKIIFKTAKYFLDLFIKIDYDERYQSREQRERVIGILFNSLVDNFFTKGEELLLKLKQFNEINIILSTIMLWTMRNCNRDTLIEWWKKKTLYFANDLNDISIIFYVLKFFKNVVLSFRGISKERSEQQSKKLDFVSKSYQIVVYLIFNLFIGKEGGMTKHLISVLENVSDSAADDDTVEALLYKLIQLIRHTVIHSLLRHDGNTCFIMVKSVMTELITNFAERISVHEISNSRDLSMKFLKKENKFRLLIALLMFMEKSHSLLVFCPDANDLDYDTDVFRAHCANCSDILLSEYLSRIEASSISNINEAEPEDYIVDLESKSLKAATLEASINKILGFNPENDIENTENFSQMFYLTYNLFSSPEHIIDILISKYKHLNQQSKMDSSKKDNLFIAKINLERTAARLIKDGFYAFNNLSIAKSINFMREIEHMSDSSSSSIAKIQNALLLNVLSIQASSGSRCNITSPGQDGDQSTDKTLILPKGLTLQMVSTPQIPMSKWNHDRELYFTTQRITNPFKITFDIVAWPSNEIAHQLTLLEAKFFLKIKPYEFYYIESKDKEIREKYSSNILFMQEHFKLVQHWANEMVLVQTNDRDRKKVFTKVLCSAQSCYQQNNFFGFMALLGALRSTSVYRIKELYEDNKEVHKLYQELEDCQKKVINSKEIAAMYDSLSEKQLPCVPYLGSFQSQVLFTKEGNKPLLDHPKSPNKKVINYKMMRILLKTLERVASLQQLCLNYDFQELAYLQFVFTEELPRLIHHSDEDLWEISTKIKPSNRQLAD
ncbi:rasGEF domain-containing protein [Naegleria gruberi]|uniref:RasGEF domain-containing protein n=1 Tax=Naegleria gruberi TaxID=5762 RepID=D2VVW0_NAEGR|nr:rasGEF domain-containing protein [Naegleria gruberi]EFC39172.1 rasGEF domain-containing protein [Naegleria gruberi]|eukprot:XP_002671916.1 rasGEF domain-containing protein [Naegleria gruberi strain NEG-M]